jgi:hypothetical protein
MELITRSDHTLAATSTTDRDPLNESGQVVSNYIKLAKFVAHDTGASLSLMYSPNKSPPIYTLSKHLLFYTTAKSSESYSNSNDPAVMLVLSLKLA